MKQSVSQYSYSQYSDTQHQSAAQDDHPQELIIPTLDTEQQEGVHEYDTDSGDDTPDVDVSDLTWVAPGPGGDNNTERRAGQEEDRIVSFTQL